MDDDVCLECGAATEDLRTQLTLPSGALTRRWRECTTCGWESAYEDAVTR